MEDLDFRTTELRVMARMVDVDPDEFLQRCGVEGDPYYVLASMKLGKPVSEVTKVERYAFKHAFFYQAYGVSGVSPRGEDGPARIHITDVNAVMARFDALLKRMKENGYTSTGRLNSRDPRLWNIPTRKEEKDGDGE